MGKIFNYKVNTIYQCQIASNFFFYQQIHQLSYGSKQLDKTDQSEKPIRHYQSEQTDRPDQAVLTSPAKPSGAATLARLGNANTQTQYTIP